MSLFNLFILFAAMKMKDQKTHDRNLEEIPLKLQDRKTQDTAAQTAATVGRLYTYQRHGKWLSHIGHQCR